MRLILNIITQSLALSWAELRSAKFRSFLSLLGITIGILCIISVQTAVNSLEMNIKTSFSKFGNDVLYIQRWPWEFSDNYAWWKYINRPAASIEEMETLEKRMKTADAMAIIFQAGSFEAEYTGKTAQGVKVSGISSQYDRIKSIDFVSGRYFSSTEFQSGANSCILGAAVAKALSEGTGELLGKTIKIQGKKFSVRGILEKEGEDMFGFSLDNSILVPYNYIANLINIRESDEDPLIAVTPKPGIPIDEVKYEITGNLRAIRRIPPGKEDNFAINKISMFTEGISSYLKIVRYAGWFIGLFSVLVGGFGIANIMFVSVKERTYIIGLKKAIGAHQIYILSEFLLESVMLCLLGGVIGLSLVFIIFTLLDVALRSGGSSFVFQMTWGNVLLGLGLSAGIGILAGFIPAWSASKMKPVDALRT